uniref:Uncharacterized protein n=1 Tax=Ditylum brightwellii TaxID=49249 RepID=A0A7S1ZQ65_9STRA|mmetsp:Transcript_36409/g.54371  ORF Transcript_36409/g.54371 Transcript_36409/m.54371 type:complete len:264 (+) Transcript_36409:101-892(+)
MKNITIHFNVTVLILWLGLYVVLGIDCGCPSTCTPDALAEYIGAHKAHSCKAQIEWLMTGHGLPEATACAEASESGPFVDDEDGETERERPCRYEACHPEGCGSTLPNDNNREYDGIFVEMEREQRLKDGIYTAASAPQHQTKHTKSENSDGSSILFNFLSFLTGSVVVVIGFVYKSRRRPTRTPATSNNEVVEDENTTEVIFPKQDSLIVPRTPPRRGSFGSFKREINAICSDSDYDSEADDSGADDDVSVEDVPEWLSAIS